MFLKDFVKVFVKVFFFFFLIKILHFIFYEIKIVLNKKVMPQKVSYGKLYLVLNDVSSNINNNYPRYVIIKKVINAYVLNSHAQTITSRLICCTF